MNRREPIKITLLGNGAVGKTSLISRYMTDSFSSLHSPSIGSDFCKRMISVDQLVYEIHLWDTAGQEVYKSITPLYVRNTHILLICFDPTDKDVSCENQIQPWMNILNDKHQTWILFLVATKCDVYGEYGLSHELCENLKRKFNARGVYITSARNGTNINGLFEGAVRSYLSSPITEIEKSGLLLETRETNKGTCCK